MSINVKVMLGLTAGLFIYGLVTGIVLIVIKL